MLETTLFFLTQLYTLVSISTLLICFRCHNLLQGFRLISTVPFVNEQPLKFFIRHHILHCLILLNLFRGTKKTCWLSTPSCYLQLATACSTSSLLLIYLKSQEIAPLRHSQSSLTESKVPLNQTLRHIKHNFVHYNNH